MKLGLPVNFLNVGMIIMGYSPSSIGLIVGILLHSFTGSGFADVGSQSCL